MAISVNGITIPSGAIVIPVVQFNPVVLGVNGSNEWDGTKVRSIYVQLPVYGSKLLFQELNPPLVKVDDFSQDFTRDLTVAEYDSYTPEELDGFTLEFIEDSLGLGTCEIIDPYIIDP